MPSPGGEVGSVTESTRAKFYLCGTLELLTACEYWLIFPYASISSLLNSQPPKGREHDLFFITDREHNVWCTEGLTTTSWTNEWMNRWINKRIAYSLCLFHAQKGTLINFLVTCHHHGLSSFTKDLVFCYVSTALAGSLFENGWCSFFTVTCIMGDGLGNYSLISEPSFL